MTPSVSISHKDFRFLQKNSYTRFLNMTSRVYSAVKFRYPEYSTSRTLCPSCSTAMCRHPLYVQSAKCQVEFVFT